jgi:hypothetical protein
MSSKTAGSAITDGTPIFDLTWTVNVADAPDAPPCENEEEIITDVILTWTPADGGNPVVARAQDPDGEGPQDLQILDEVNLLENTEYTLTLELRNELEGEDITEEIMEEDDEHMFFFAFSEGIFSDPTGDGNTDNRDDPVNYNDFDENNLPVGLSTAWTTAAEMTSGSIRIILKHQPGVKSSTSTVEDGGTDLDLTWTVNTGVTSVRDRWEEQRRRLQLYPNPVREQLNWLLDGTVTREPVEIRIFSATGQLLKAYRSPEPRIDISQLANGIYIFQLQNGQEIISKRFVKSE